MHHAFYVLIAPGIAPPGHSEPERNKNALLGPSAFHAQGAPQDVILARFGLRARSWALWAYIQRDSHAPLSKHARLGPTRIRVISPVRDIKYTPRDSGGYNRDRISSNNVESG